MQRMQFFTVLLYRLLLHFGVVELEGPEVEFTRSPHMRSIALHPVSSPDFSRVLSMKIIQPYNFVPFTKMDRCARYITSMYPIHNNAKCSLEKATPEGIDWGLRKHGNGKLIEYGL